jgi:hypothetical protein
MGKLILIGIGLIIMVVSVVMVYDARIIASNVFSSNEVNETTKILKVVGYITLMIGLLIIYFAK